MAVDIHPGKAINQRPPGDLDLFQVRLSQLARRKGLGQRPPGQFDQFGIVAADGVRLVMIGTEALVAPQQMVFPPQPAMH